MTFILTSSHHYQQSHHQNEMMGTGGRSKAHTANPSCRYADFCFAVGSAYPALNALKYGQTHHAER